MITNYIVERLDCSITVPLAGAPPASAGTASADPAANVQTWTRCSMTKNTHFSDELVESNHKYQYRVVAQNLQGRSVPCEPTSVITTLETKSRTKRWTEDETGKRRRGKDGFAPSDYDKCCKKRDHIQKTYTVYELFFNHMKLIKFSSDHDVWSKGQPQPADIKVGSVYDYYDIYEEIGRFVFFLFCIIFIISSFSTCSGAFGVVHRAVEKRTGRSFAAKFVSTPSSTEKATVKKECEIMNQLIHPRLLNLHDIFDESDEMVLITEL